MSVSVDELRRLLTSPDARWSIERLNTLATEFAKRKYLLSSIFYEYYVDIMEATFGAEGHGRACWLRVYPPSHSLFTPPSGSIFHLVFRAASFPPRFQLPITALPPPIQREIINDTTEPQTLLSSPLYRNKLKSLAPAAAGGGVPSSPSPALSQQQTIVLELTIYEYYFMAMANYLVHHGHTAELYDPKPTSLGSTTLSSLGQVVTAPLSNQTAIQQQLQRQSEAAYQTLIIESCHYFLPHAVVTPDGHVTSPAPVEHGDSFLLILSEVWLGQNAYSPQIMYPTPAIATASVSVNRPLIPGTTSTAPPHTLAHATPSAAAAAAAAAAYLESPGSGVHFEIPSLQLSDSILRLVLHLLSDPAYQPLSPSDDSTIGISPALQSIQKQIFHFLRTAALRWPHDWDARFSALCEIWLAYIQPWDAPRAYQAVVYRKGGGGEVKEYEPRWRAYILANFPFYTTLLVDLLRLMQDLDLGREGSRERTAYLHLFHRILLVYQGPLLQLIQQVEPLVTSHSTHVAQYNDAHVLRGQLLYLSSLRPEHYIPLSPALPSSVSSLDTLDLTVESVHTASRRYAMELLRILLTQRGRKGTLPSSAPSPQLAEQDQILKQVEQKLRQMFDLREEFASSARDAAFENESKSSQQHHHQEQQRVSHVMTQRSVSTVRSLDPDRDPRDPYHRLTDEGRFQIKHGLRVCSRNDVPFIGTVWDRPVCSYELQPIVNLTRHASAQLNKRVGSKLGINFNLRFLANQYVLMFLIIILWLLYRIIF